MRNILFQVANYETKYLPFLKPILGGKCNLSISNVTPSTVTEVMLRAREKGCSAVATNDETLLRLLLPEKKKGVSLDNYAGSIIEKMGIEFLILPPLEQLLTIPYMRFLYDRYFTKFLHPENWLAIPEFTWELFDPSRVEHYLGIFNNATFISSDIETGPEQERIITCIGFTAVKIDSVSKSFTAFTLVVPFTDIFNVLFARTVLQCPAAKVFQNGKYDIAYLLRYRSPVTNYAFDTINLFHSWLCELPKTLDFITAFLLRKCQYWKSDKDTYDIMEYYAYNGRDAFNTAMCLLSLLMEMPPWALENYKQEFPVVYPSMSAEANGLKCDLIALARIDNQLVHTTEEELKKLQTMVGCPSYNPNSPQQTAKLFAVLGCEDIKGTGKIPQDKVASRHPLNKKIMSTIEKVRGVRKLRSSYTINKRKPKNGKERNDIIWNNRWYYALNPHGTDTGRNASKESQFWCGVQIQNIPRDRKDVQIKDSFIADDGFYLGECDGEQAEARYTAYLSGDVRLIAAVEDKTKDFHSLNASAFFGVPYDKITNSYFEEQIKEWVHETIDKVLRDLSKRTNHGANYNMGPQVMLDTMGIENVMRAKKLLNLPQHYSLLQVTGYLLQKYAEAYPTVKGDWYDKVKGDIRGTSMLVGPTGWTRYCFGNPDKNKRHLNSYVAHPPQSLNAMILNKGYVRVFNELVIKEREDFKLGPQIHDSILFQYRIGRHDLAWKVKECMEIPVAVKDTFGITRTMVVPAALKGEHTVWSKLIDAKKWQHQKAA